MLNAGPMAKCRNCGKESPADTFVLDPVYGMMVCQACVKSRKTPQKIKPGQEQREMQSRRPVEKIIPNTNAARAALQSMQKKPAMDDDVDDFDDEPVRSSVRNTGGPRETPAKKVPVEKPTGWDREDDFIDRAYSAKQKQKAAVEGTVVPIDDDHVKYTCKKCKYAFKYNLEKKQPAHCPYCGADIRF
ncbi:MAG: hypothetical protein V1725_07115 [archaeon]